MMELPEVLSISRQADQVLKGKVVNKVFPPVSPHKFAFFNDDPENYKPLLIGRKVLSVTGSGMFIDISFDNDTTITLGDGIIIRYGDASAKIPDKYQLLLTFEDNTFLSFTVAMYGAIYAYKGAFDNKYYVASKEKISPLSDSFDETYFLNLFLNEKKTLSVKGLLATEQRIPGVGNGVIQDILFKARINPKRKALSLSEEERKTLFHSLKTTLHEMTDQGGRNTESNFYGEKGGYQTILSAKTYKQPCPVCGGFITKEAYMGGSVYYCLNCQPL